jgi:hypothetical protein
MRVRTYYWELLRRGFADTRKHATRIALGSALLVFVFGAWLGCWWKPEGEACDVESVTAGVAAVAIYLLLAFGVNLVRAPVRMHQEALVALRPGSTELPLAVRLVRFKMLSQERQVDWRFRAYQLADGVALEWATRPNDPQATVPASAKCLLVVPRGYGIPGSGTVGAEKATWRIPGDFGDMTPTTGSVEFVWSAERGQVDLLPPLHVIRGQPAPPGWKPPDRTAPMECARATVDLEVMQDGKLV